MASSVELEAEALLEDGLQLHAAEAVEVEVFGEAEGVGVGVWWGGVRR